MRTYNLYSFYRSTTGQVFERPATASIILTNATAAEVDAEILKNDDEDKDFWIEDHVTGKVVEYSEIM